MKRQVRDSIIIETTTSHYHQPRSAHQAGRRTIHDAPRCYTCAGCLLLCHQPPPQHHHPSTTDPPKTCLPTLLFVARLAATMHPIQKAIILYLEPGLHDWAVWVQSRLRGVSVRSRLQRKPVLLSPTGDVPTGGMVWSTCVCAARFASDSGVSWDSTERKLSLSLVRSVVDIASL